MLHNLDLTRQSALRWLDVGRDVAIRGDDGSGRTTVLRALMADASRRGVTSIMLHAAGPARHAALLTHESAGELPRGAREVDLVHWLAGELAGGRSLLLVDDFDQIDEGSAAIIRQVLDRSGISLAFTTRIDPVRSTDHVVRAVVADRAPAAVQVHPLGFTSMSRLAAAVLGAPADISVTSSLLARSAGNPRVAVAMIDAARYCGAIARVDGRWTKASSMDRAPTDLVANALLPRLDEAEVDVLELLATTGPLEAEKALAMMDPAVLGRMIERGRVVGHPNVRGEEQLAVSPPALADALRDRFTRHRENELRARAAAFVGREAATPSGRSDLDGLFVDRPDEDGTLSAWITRLSALVLERAEVDEAALRAAWQAEPDVARANAYLQRLMLRPAHQRIAEVFATTRLCPGDDTFDRAQFWMARIIWSSWSKQAPEQIEALVTACTDEASCYQYLFQSRDEILQMARDGVDIDLQMVERLPDVDPRLREQILACRAGVLVEVGRPDLALALCEAGGLPRLPRPAPATYYLAGMRGWALLTLGEMRAAEEWTRVHLEQACEDLDLEGIRVHGSVLGQVMLMSGRPEAAWRAISMVLRLGPNGPMENPWHGRNLMTAAVMRCRLGDLSMAEELVADLEDGSPYTRLMIDPMAPMAAAAVLRTRGQVDAAYRTVWEQGTLAAQQGLATTALLYLLLWPEPYAPEDLAVIESLHQRRPVPLLEPWMELHRSLAADTRQEAAERAAAVSAPTTALVETAYHRLRAAQGAGCLTEQLTAAVLPQGALSDREREVAALARSGLSNREIGDKLYLSVRTVENHMSRILRKLGFTSRVELSAWHGL